MRLPFLPWLAGICLVGGPVIAAHAASDQIQLEPMLPITPETTTVQTVPAPSSAPIHAPSRPFTATVVKDQYLPPDMYGQWSVRANLTQTNAPHLFAPFIQEIWELSQSGEVVTISNPASGATASISVEAVHGNTATFHHIVQEGRDQLFIETPTVSVQGDRLSGVTLNQYRLLNKNAPPLFGHYELYAIRIAGPRVQFGNPGAEPTIIIEEPRVETR